MLLALALLSGCVFGNRGEGPEVPDGVMRPPEATAPELEDGTEPCSHCGHRSPAGTSVAVIDGGELHYYCTEECAQEARKTP